MILSNLEEGGAALNELNNFDDLSNSALLLNNTVLHSLMDHGDFSVVKQLRATCRYLKQFVEVECHGKKFVDRATWVHSDEISLIEILSIPASKLTVIQCCKFTGSFNLEVVADILAHLKGMLNSISIDGTNGTVTGDAKRLRTLQDFPKLSFLKLRLSTHDMKSLHFNPFAELVQVDRLSIDFSNVSFSCMKNILRFFKVLEVFEDYCYGVDPQVCFMNYAAKHSILYYPPVFVKSLPVAYSTRFGK